LPISRRLLTPKRPNADTPIRPNADTPIRRHADTPTRRYADTPTPTPTRRYADTPIRRYADADTPIRSAHADTLCPSPYALPTPERSAPITLFPPGSKSVLLAYAV
jgi:hypothetical protein